MDATPRESGSSYIGPMYLSATQRLYWNDDHCFAAEAEIIGAQDTALAFDRTCFYPGGGGQPPDEGTVTLANGEVLRVASMSPFGKKFFYEELRKNRSS